MRRHAPDPDEIRPRRGSLAAVLRREAFAERPAFSGPFHDRLARRMAAAGRASQGPRPPGRGIGRPAAWRPGGVVALTVALAAVSLLLVTSGTDGGRSAGIGPVAVAPGPAVLATAGDEPLGLDRLPTFDELEEGVHAGVASLAAALFEVPAWTALADFDVGMALDPAAAP